MRKGIDTLEIITSGRGKDIQYRVEPEVLCGFKRLVTGKYIRHISWCLESNFFSKTKLPSNASGTSDMIREPDQVIEERKLDSIPKCNCNHFTWQVTKRNV